GAVAATPGTTGTPASATAGAATFATPTTAGAATFAIAPTAAIAPTNACGAPTTAWATAATALLAERSTALLRLTRRQRGSGREGVVGDHGDAAADGPLDVTQEDPLLAIDERERHPA